MKTPAVVLVGAGLSTSSGIPDYRSGDGLWSRFDPQEFNIARFHADPDRFWARRVELVKESRLLDAQPNGAHHLLADAVRAGRVSTIVTQNIDGLHHKAGTPPECVIEVHGNSARCICIDCDAVFQTAEIIASYKDKAPRCPCGGFIKPDVVLFGERVDALDRAIEAVRAVPTLVAVGTSLQVWPVAGLVSGAIDDGRDVIIINREATPFDTAATRVIRGDVEQGLRSLFAPQRV